MCSYLVYTSFPLIGVVGLSVTLIIYLPGASKSKAQMVAPCGAVRAMVPVTPLVTPCSWRSLNGLEVCSTILRLVRACSHRDGLLVALSVEVTALGLLWQSPGSGLLLWGFLISALDLQRSLVFCLLPWRSQIHVPSCFLKL